MPAAPLLPLVLIAPVRAGTIERPTLPFAGAAAEDGVHVLYLNPALMGFDRDAGYGIYFDRGLSADAPSSLALATTGSGLGAGISYRELTADASWWSLSSGLALPIGRHFDVGSAFHWQLPDGGEDNFVSWDIGAAWRPAPWLGLGGTIQNLGNPAPDLGVYTTYDAGLALRPVGDLITLGVDYLAEDPPDSIADKKIGASLRSRPYRGVWLRLYGDYDLTRTAAWSAGGALELHFADLGVGYGAHMDSTGTGSAHMGGYLTTVHDNDQLFLSGRTVAKFVLDGSYPYQPMGGLFDEENESYLSLLRRIENASRDPQVKGLLFDVDGAPFSFAQVEELRALMTKARANGKPVVVYLDREAGNAAYLLATGADRVYLHPAGSLDLLGLSAETMYYKGAMDLVGVQAQYAQRAEYKSGPEPMTRREGSDPAREEMGALLDDLYASLVSGVASGRHKTEDEVRALIDQGPFTGKEAVDKGLVDGLVYPDELRDKVDALFPKGYHADDRYGYRVPHSGWEPTAAVAVVVIDGAIDTGHTSPGGLLGGAHTGSETVVDELDEARHTPAVKAVVLRIDSPGGSAFASDEIWRAVERVKKSGKPVVVSMGGLAASGGYYSAAGATAIYALPTTITGSIGVYGGKINLKGLYEKLQLNVEATRRGRNAGMFSMNEPFDPVEYAALDRMIGDTYRQFKEKVAEGRGMTVDDVDLVARGRVWSGTDAKDKKLVDEMGGLYDAIERARREAGMSSTAAYTLITYDPWSGDGDEVPAQAVKAVVRKIQATLSPVPKLDLPEELQVYGQLATLQDTHVFAMMPYHLVLR